MGNKKNIFALILIVVFIPLILIFYMLSFQIMKAIDPNIFNLYASSGKSTVNPYFNEEVFNNAEVSNVINSILEEYQSEHKEEAKSSQDAYRILIEEKDKTNNLLLQNSEYKNYLSGKGLNTDGFWDFAEKMSHLDDNIIKAVLYLLFLLYVLVFYFCFKYRKGIYWTAFIIYLLLAANEFSGGLASYMLYPLLIKVQPMPISEFSELFGSLFPALKEAILTYILLDTIYQIEEDKKKDQDVYLLREIYSSLIIIERILIRSKGKEFNVIKLDIQFTPMLKFIRHRSKKDKNSRELEGLLSSLPDNFPYSSDKLLKLINETIKLIEKNNYLMQCIKYDKFRK